MAHLAHLAHVAHVHHMQHVREMAAQKARQSMPMMGFMFRSMPMRNLNSTRMMPTLTTPITMRSSFGGSDTFNTMTPISMGMSSNGMMPAMGNMGSMDFSMMR